MSSRQAHHHQQQSSSSSYDAVKGLGINLLRSKWCSCPLLRDETRRPGYVRWTKFSWRSGRHSNCQRSTWNISNTLHYYYLTVRPNTLYYRSSHRTPSSSSWLSSNSSSSSITSAFILSGGADKGVIIPCDSVATRLSPINLCKIAQRNERVQCQHHSRRRRNFNWNYIQHPPFIRHVTRASSGIPN